MVTANMFPTLESLLFSRASSHPGTNFSTVKSLALYPGARMLPGRPNFYHTGSVVVGPKTVTSETLCF